MEPSFRSRPWVITRLRSDRDSGAPSAVFWVGVLVGMLVMALAGLAASSAFGQTLDCPQNCVCTMSCLTTTTSTTSTSTTVRVTTTTVPSECGTAVALSGPQSKRLSRTLPPSVEATGAVWTGTTWGGSRYPIVLSGAGCFTGGSVVGTYDQPLTWKQMHAMNHAALVVKGPIRVEGFRATNMLDGLRPETSGSQGWTLVGSAFTHLRDDGVEADAFTAGTVRDSLFDGVYVFLSSRNDHSRGSGASLVTTVRDSLIRLEPMPGPDGPTTDGLGHGDLFKLDHPDTPADSYSPRLAIHDNVFLLERASVSAKRSGFPRDEFIASCGGNTLVWLGQGEPPGLWPARCMKQITRDRRVWDDAVAAWKARHP